MVKKSIKGTLISNWLIKSFMPKIYSKILNHCNSNIMLILL